MGRPSTGKTKQDQKRQDYERHRQAYIDRASRHYEANKEEKKAYAREREVAGRKDRVQWAKFNLNTVKTRAKKHGLEFDLTADDIAVPNVCPIFGIALIPGSGRNHPNSPSVDRIDNDKGYVRGNVKVISWRANALKGNGSLDEHRRIVAYMEREIIS